MKEMKLCVKNPACDLVKTNMRLQIRGFVKRLTFELKRNRNRF